MIAEEVLPMAAEVAERYLPQTTAAATHMSLEALDIARAKFASLAGPEALANADSVLVGMKKFVERHTEQFPQVSAKGEFQYGFGGSLGSSLSTTARSIKILDSSALPQIKIAQEIQLGTEAHTAGLGYVRRAGDVDYVASHEYHQDKSGMSWGSAWTREGRQRAWGNSHDIDTAKAAFKQPDRENLPYPADGMDSRWLSDGDRVGIIDSNGKSIFVVSPDVALAYKFTQGMRERDAMSSPENFGRDISGLLVPAQSMFSRKEVIDRIAEKLFEPRIFERPLREMKKKAGWAAQSTHFADLASDVAKAHPDFKFVQDLPGANRFLGLDYVHATNRFPNPISKENVASWIGDNRTAWQGRLNDMFRMIGEADVENPLKSLVKQ